MSNANIQPVYNPQSTNDNITIGNTTYTSQYANDPANQEVMRQAVVNGNNQISVSSNNGNSWNNATGVQTGFAPIPTPVVAPKAPTFDSKAYINGIVTAGNASADSANASRQAIINARLQEQLGSQAGLERDAQGNLVKATETINGNVYDAQETQRATGVQRGVQYSQQQQAVENGVSRAGMKMIVDAGKERDTAILNIKDRIASLKSGASYEIQASQAQADAEKAKVFQEATQNAFNRENQLSDMQTGFNREDYTTSVDQKFQTDMQDKQYIQQGQLLDKTWNREDEVKFEDRKYTEEQQGKQWTREDAVADKAFNRQVEAMGIDQKYKVELQNLDFSQKKEFLKLETQQQKDILEVKNKYDVDMFGMTSALQIKIEGMGNATQMALGQLSANTQQSIAQANINADESKFIASINAEKNKQMTELAGNFLMNDPNFKWSNNTDASAYFNVIGMPQDLQNKILKSGGTNPTVKEAVEQVAKSKNTTVVDMNSSLGDRLHKVMFGK